MFVKPVLAEMQAEDRSRRLALLAAFCGASIATMPVTMILAPLANPAEASDFIYNGAFIGAAAALILALARRGSLELASWGLLCTMWLLLSRMAWSGRLVQGTAYWGYI